MRKCFYCCDSDLTQTNHIVFPRGESNLKMHVLFWGAITILCCFIWRTCLRKGISETSHRIHHDSWCLSETRSVCVKLVLSKDLSALCLISFCVCETEHDCLPASLQGKKNCAHHTRKRLTGRKKLTFTGGNHCLVLYSGQPIWVFQWPIYNANIMFDKIQQFNNDNK